jgi:hypothetical protein
MDTTKMRQDIDNNRLLEMTMPNGQRVLVPAKESWNANIEATRTAGQISRWAAENNLTNAEAAEKLNLVNFNGRMIPATKAAELETHIIGVGITAKASVASAGIGASAQKYSADQHFAGVKYATDAETKQTTEAQKMGYAILTKGKEDMGKYGPAMFRTEGNKTTIAPGYKDYYLSLASTAGTLYNTTTNSMIKADAKAFLDQGRASDFIDPITYKKLLKGDQVELPKPGYAVPGATTAPVAPTTPWSVPNPAASTFNTGASLAPTPGTNAWGNPSAGKVLSGSYTPFWKQAQSGVSSALGLGY